MYTIPLVILFIGIVLLILNIYLVMIVNTLLKMRLSIIRSLM